MRRLIPPLMLLLTAAAGAWLWEPAPTALPEELPLTFTDGTSSDFGQLRGTPLLLTFWSVNCPTCLHDMPKLAALHEELSPKEASVIAVSIPQDPPPAIMATVRAFRPGYPTALDVQGDIARAVAGVEATPLTLLIDREGRIVHRSYGKLDMQEARAILGAL